MINPAPSNGTVLIVDDTPGNLALLSDTLSEANYRVLVATDGESAIEQLNYLQPDIILLDVMMPGIDGFETCSRLKSDPDTAGIPILFMTGLSELDHLLRGFGEGALDYIVKPIRPPEVLARIEVHLSQTRNLRRTERLMTEQKIAAMAVDENGKICWLTAAAEDWLAEFNLQNHENPESNNDDSLPSSLLSWFKTWLGNQLAKNEATEHYFNAGFMIQISLCEYPNQYLCLLYHEVNKNDWAPELLREKLKLTFREAEILMWIARGKTNKEIGIILSTSPRTVNKHLEHIFEKLGVSTRAAAVASVLEKTGKHI